MQLGVPEVVIVMVVVVDLADQQVVDCSAAASSSTTACRRARALPLDPHWTMMRSIALHVRVIFRRTKTMSQKRLLRRNQTGLAVTVVEDQHHLL